MKLTQEDLDNFLEQVPRSETYKDLCKDLLGPFVGGELNEVEVVRYAKMRFKNPNSYNLCLAVFKSFSKWKRSKIPPVDRNHLMQRFELEQIEGIKREPVVRRLEEKGLELDELAGILKRCEDSVDFATVWLLYWFGCRPIELVSLTPKMVDWSGRSVKFATAKTKVEREIFFDDFTAKQLRVFLEAKLGYMKIYMACKRLGIIPKSGRQTLRSLMPSRVDWIPPVRVHELIDLWCGHTVAGMDAVYSEIRPHLKRLADVHYMKPLEGAKP